MHAFIFSETCNGRFWLAEKCNADRKVTCKILVFLTCIQLSRKEEKCKLVLQPIKNRKAVKY